MWRAQNMLKQLSKQIVEISPNFAGKPEIIVDHDPNHVVGKQIEQIIKRYLENCLSLIQLKILSAPGLDYTALKNFGVKNSSNEVIIFIDCDVIPGDGWLQGLLEAFDRQDLNVVGGNSFMYTNSLCEKAFVLFWSFPPKSNMDNHICETQIFFANNVAFRREILESHPLPTLPQYRGQNLVLAEELWRNRIKIFHQPKSKVYHPVPNGLRHFVIRALCQGHDIAVTRKRDRNSKIPSLLNNDLRNRRSFSRIFSTMRKRYHHVDLSLKHLVPALTIIMSYYILTFIGIGISSINPQFIRNHFSI